MSDESEIYQLFSQESGETKYKDRQLSYLNQVGGATVAAGQSSIKWSFQDVKKQWLSLAGGWLSVPISVEKGAANFSSNPILAVKQSLLSLIDRVRITRISGEELVNESGIHLSSNLKLFLEQNPHHLTAIAAQLQYAKDEPNPDQIRGMVADNDLKQPQIYESTYTIPTTLPVGSAKSFVVDKNPHFNVGFARRRNFLLNAAMLADGTANYDATKIEFTANIPLNFIHDWFQQMGFPIFNLNIEIEISFHTTGSTSFKPFCYGQKIDGTKETGGVYKVSLKDGSQPRLYYYKVKMTPEEEMKAVKMTDAGYQKTITYSHYRFKEIAVADGSERDHEILVDAAAPKRVFVLCHESATVRNGDEWANPILTGARGITNANIYVRDVRYFSQNLTTLEQQWEALRAQFPKVDTDGAGALNFTEFAQRYRIACFDISREQDFVDYSGSSVLRVSCGCTAASTLLFIIEEQKRAVYSLDGSGISLVARSA